MEKNPLWEFKSYWASQEISRILWNSYVPYRIQKLFTFNFKKHYI